MSISPNPISCVTCIGITLDKVWINSVKQFTPVGAFFIKNK